MLGKLILAMALLVSTNAGAGDTIKPKFFWVKEKEVICDSEEALRQYLAKLAKLTASQVALDQACRFQETEMAYAVSGISFLEQDSELILIGKLYLWTKPNGPVIFTVMARGILEGAKET